jgi:REP-associated tyrosine transposase
MPQSLAQVYLHLVFSTKNRAPFIRDQAFRKALHAYLAGTCEKLESPSLKVGGVEDHVHILCRFGRKMSIADLLRELKRESSKWATREHGLQDFEWQAGYGAFSVSPSHLEALTRYRQSGGASPPRIVSRRVPTAVAKVPRRIR